MALIREIVTSAVHWRLPNQNATNAANEILARIGLNANQLKYFARLQVNSNRYEWHAEGSWQPLKDADAIERAAALAMVENARRDLQQTLKGPAENFLKLPNDDDYIFFSKDATGVTDIIFTGWGFENCRRMNDDGGKVAPPSMPQLVRLGFTSDGQIIPNREFLLNAGGATNKRVTDAEGYFNVGMLPEGTTLTVTDIITNRVFTHTVQSGLDNYLGDVTEKATVTVRLTRNGLPCTTDELVTIDYNGIPQTLTAAPGMPAITMLTVSRGAVASVSALGDTQQRELLAGNNDFLFNVDTPRADVRVKMTHTDGQPYVAETVSVSYNGNNYTVITDEKGEGVLTLDYAQGESCVVTTSLGTKDAQLRPAYEELFDFVEPEVPLPPVLDYNLRFIDKDEHPHSNISVVLKQGATEWPAILDENGQMTLPHGVFTVGQPIDITMHCPDTRIDGVHLTLDPDEYEYVIQTIEKKPGSRWWVWLLLILAGLILIGGTMWGLHEACKALGPWSRATFFN